MLTTLPSPTRREFLTASAAAIAVGAIPAALRAAAVDPLIRPFAVAVPQAELDELRGRIANTRWPERETVGDASQGIPLGRIRSLVEHWGSAYDWRKVEAKLNALPQYLTEIDGLDIHFLHIRSRHANALPLIMTHGWPGSVLELLKSVGPLTDPTAHGGSADDAFHLVLPSLPGFGFSAKPTTPGWGTDRIARAWAELMRRVGYSRYVAQGGDWGSPVCNAMGRLAPEGLLGIHVNLPAIVPPEIATILRAGGPAPVDLTETERETFESLAAAARMGNRSYAVLMGSRPQTIGYSLTDSPAGLAAWMLGHPGFSRWTWSRSDPEKSPDEVLDDVTLYWLTNTATSSGRIYWEYGGGRSPAFSAPEETHRIALPVAITVFPGESYRAPESWARRAYPGLTYLNTVDRGGHFAAWEQPDLFSAELRAAFRPLRRLI